MNWLFRRILLFTSAAAFLIVAPIIVLYAVGYRLQSANEPTAVGVLLLETSPRRATVFIDGEEVGTTPESVSGLAPGPTHVSIEKSGYAPWEKTIQIESNRATEFRSVRLFANQTQSQPILDETQIFSISPNRSLIIAATSEAELIILDQTGEVVGQPLALPSIPTALLWSPDSASLIITYQNGNRELIEVQDVSTIRQTLPALRGVREVAWDPRLPGRLLLLRQNGDLASFSLQTQSTTRIASNVAFFAPTTRDIVVVTTDNEIQWYSLTGQQKATTTLKELSQDIVSVAASPSGNIIIRAENNDVYVFTDTSVATRLPLGGDVRGWSPDGTLLLLQPNANELAVYNVDNERLQHFPIGTAQTIVRLSRPVRASQWFAGGAHVIYQVDDEIVISEIDTRDISQSFTVDTTNLGDASAAVGAQGNTVWYLKKTGGIQTLVYKDLLTEEDTK